MRGMSSASRIAARSSTAYAVLYRGALSPNCRPQAPIISVVHVAVVCSSRQSMAADGPVPRLSINKKSRRGRSGLNNAK